MKTSDANSGFTLVELIMTIAIVAVLSTIVFVVIRPQDRLEESRDSRRIADIQSIDAAMQEFATVSRNLDLGSSSVVYTSLPDTSTTCANYALPDLPSGWSYHCSPSADLQKVDGTGWIPVDFTSVSTPPIQALPIDPTNTDTGAKYYTYVTSGNRFVVASLLESSRMLRDAAMTEGGADPARYEKGSNPMLWAQATGLVGWWSLDGDASDRSPNGYDGTVEGTPDLIDCVSKQCYSFTSNESFDAGSLDEVSGVQHVSILAWMRRNVEDAQVRLGKEEDTDTSGSGDQTLSTFFHHTGRLYWGVSNTTSFTGGYTTLNDTNWHHTAITFDGTQGTNDAKMLGYVDGNEASLTYVGTLPSQTPTEAGNFTIGKMLNSYSNGAIDEVMVFSRVLSDAEIKAIYDAQR